MNIYGLFDIAGELFAGIGTVVVTIGVLFCVVTILRALFFGRLTESVIAQARTLLCQSIVFGLDFMVAGDVVKSMVVPTGSNVVILGVLVVIRTVLNYSLSYELAYLEKKR